MRESSPELPGYLTGSFDYRWSVDLALGGIRRFADLPVADTSFSEDGDAKVQQGGSCTVVWTDELATSISPRDVGDPLSPFGAQLWVSCIVTAGPFEERVAFARFEITDVPSARDEEMEFHGEWLTVGSVVELELKELTAGTGAESFDVPTAPTSLTSAWGEIGRLVGMPISRTVPDRALTRSVMYEDNKLDAVYELADVMLDAIPHMTASGALAARPNAWPEPVATLTRAEHLVSVGQSMSAANVYNRVVVRATGGDQTSILAVAEITEGPLRVSEPDGSRSPFGRRTRYQSSELVTTEAQAAEWARSTLAQVSTPRAQVLPVVEVFNPLRERGDVVLIERPTEWLLGRVATIRRGGDGKPTQEMNVEIGARRPK